MFPFCHSDRQPRSHTFAARDKYDLLRSITIYIYYILIYLDISWYILIYLDINIFDIDRINIHMFCGCDMFLLLGMTFPAMSLCFGLRFILVKIVVFIMRTSKCRFLLDTFEFWDDCDPHHIIYEYHIFWYNTSHWSSNMLMLDHHSWISYQSMILVIYINLPTS